MSSKPTGPDSGFQRLIDEGYEAEVRQQHLLVHSVPYVASNRQIARGTLVCAFVENAGAVLPPDNHQVWWTGEYPCFANGAPIEQIRNEDGEREIFPGCMIRHRFSNKPDGVSAFPDHHHKVLHYIALIESQAKAIDSTVDSRTRRVLPIENTVSPFQYEDSASARAEIQATSARLAMGRVAIVGLGGTGSYVLDQLAKTPVSEIHLFDGDRFLQHNAFRSPGAPSLEEIADQRTKVEYFRGRYSLMHRGIVAHNCYIDQSNVLELKNTDFVFLCVDRGATRALLSRFLQAERIPFIDVGMNLQLVKGTGKLIGSCRSTLSTPAQAAHFEQCAPLDEDEQDALYRQNIQVADMNALNAQLAIMQWKQYCGFYQDDFGAHHVVFSVNSLSLVRDVFSVQGTSS